MLRDERQKRILILVIAAIATGAALRAVLAVWAGGTMIDDAYVAARYARNLVFKGQLVYNIGERALGVSGPLYSLWVALHLVLVPSDSIGYALAGTNTLFFVATALALFHLVRNVSVSAAAIAVVFFAGYLRFVDNSIIGMETPLFLLGMAVSLLLLRSGHLAWLSLVTALLMLVRPEGVLWAGSILVALAVGRHGLRLSNIVPGAAVVAAWTGFSTAYYGSPIPCSVLAKSGWLVPERTVPLTERVTTVFASLSLLELPKRIAFVQQSHVVMPFVLAGSLLLFVLGGYYLWKRRSPLLALPVVFAAYFVFYTLGRGRVDFSWYGVPSGFAYMVTAVVGLVWLVRQVRGRVWRDRTLLAMAYVVLVALLGTSIVVWRETRLPYFRSIRERYEPVGEFISRQSPTDAQVLVTETGMIGWRADRMVHETAGIVSPKVLSYLRQSGENVSLRAVLERFGTDIVVLDPLFLRALRLQGGLDWMKENYVVLAEFPSHIVLRRRSDTNGRDEYVRPAEPSDHGSVRD